MSDTIVSETNHGWFLTRSLTLKKVEICTFDHFDKRNDNGSLRLTFGRDRKTPNNLPRPNLIPAQIQHYP